MAYLIMWTVNPHLKKKVDFATIYEPLVGQTELKRRREVDHRTIMKDRRAKRKR